MSLLPKLVEASRWGQHSTAEQVGREIAQLIADTHPGVANKIHRQFATALAPARLAHRPEKLVEFRDARHGLQDVILPPDVEQECRAIIQEHQRAADLARFHLAPRHKVLLYGPPGNGKTLLAEALARELDVPFLPVKYAGLIDSHLGGTGKNLQEIFDYAATAPCLLFMDEFDGVAIDRIDAKDVGEIRRVTNQLLMLVDRLVPTCMFVAATNAQQLLDSAVLRRFDFVLQLPAPSRQLRERCIQRELAASLTPGYDLTDKIGPLADLELPNLSAVVQLCQRIRRDLVLNQGAGMDSLIAEAAGHGQGTRNT